MQRKKESSDESVNTHILKLSDVERNKETIIDRLLKIYVWPVLKSQPQPKAKNKVGDKAKEDDAAKKEEQKKLATAILQITQAFDQALEIVNSHKNQSGLYLQFFVESFADALWVTRSSMKDFFRDNDFISIDDKYNVSEETPGDVLVVPVVSEEEAKKIAEETKKIAEETAKKAPNVDDFWMVKEKKEDEKFTFVVKKGRTFNRLNGALQEESFDLERLKEPQVIKALNSFMNESLPGYAFSKTLYKHPVFKTWCLSAYPLEDIQYTEVDLSKRFTSAFTLPDNKYARPILDIEFVPDYGPCVRCYLTIPDYPRPGSNDKDITQDPKTGKVQFKDVHLMNFGDPLRALTWVEDYIKNPAHGLRPDKENTPIIRTFLIPIAEYQKNALDRIEGVDADRAPGQVRKAGDGYADLAAVNFSLVSFTDQQKTKKTDGSIKSIQELSKFLMGETLYPKNSKNNADLILHQHGRPIEKNQEKQEKYVGLQKKNVDENDDNANFIVQARLLERQAAGFSSKVPLKADENPFVRKFLTSRASVDVPQGKDRFFNQPKAAGASSNRNNVTTTSNTNVVAPGKKGKEKEKAKETHSQGDKKQQSRKQR